VQQRVDVVDRALGLDRASVGVDLDLVRFDLPVTLLCFDIALGDGGSVGGVRDRVRVDVDFVV